MSNNPRALIAEDETLLGEHLRAELQALWPELQVLGIAPHGAAAVEQTLRLQPDIVFLDIRMPGMSGLEAAEALAEDWSFDTPPPLIVFVTAYDEYALRAFEAAALDYVLKPVQSARLAQTVARLQTALQGRQPSGDPLDGLRQLLLQGGLGAPAATAPRLRHLQAAVGQSIELVPVERLIYLEAADKYVRAVTAAQEYWVRVSLRELLPQLDPERFWQVHRSTVVNIDAVARVFKQENGQAQLELHERPEKLTVSRVHAQRFKAL
ncbi:LytR/AlgR family response regulator transcription factor [Inhella sp.]|uniref:LytR/AlgR family response regulator transcription factor n=1 Tax=Inhella sp. TaxID=1921806 RepID=UPI0035B0A4B0